MVWERPPDPRALRAAVAPTRFVLAAAAITGFAFTLMELVWYRMLAPLLGGSTYTFGLILAVALLGIGLGSLARSRRRQPGTLSGFAATCGLEAALLAAPYGLGDSVAILAARLHPAGVVSFGGLVWGWSLIALLVVFPAAFLAGLQFPMLISLLGKGREKVATHVGLAYAWNTAGAIVGSLAGGFGLLPLLSAPGTGLRDRASRRSRSRPCSSAPAREPRAPAGGFRRGRGRGPDLVSRRGRRPPGGTVRSGGPGRSLRASPNRSGVGTPPRRKTFWEADGVESSVAMMTTSGGLASP